MEIISYFILGAIEGITEFLPISSTAHLILFSYLLKIPQTDFHKFFEVFIQSGAILAVFVSYFKFILNNKRLIKNIIISFIPTAIISVILYRIIKNIFFESYFLIIFMSIAVGILFIFIEYLIRSNKLVLNKSLNNLNYFQSFMIGIIQALAVIPGVSRAGAVILGMLILKFKREDSVIYSFLLAVPTIIAAGIYDLYKSGLKNLYFDFSNIIYLSVGFLTSFIFAYLTIKWFIKYLEKNDLNIFGYYRIIFGLIFLVIFML
ncbi:MAG: undecaprenyl-diphosphate phosphatase [Patescibacteria group bacterium]|nr:undecaprenyl-diphosphate phosphatase [Patescibacteria group bacterium]